MSKFKAVVFDLDGTLINTIEDIANSMNRVLNKMNLPIHELSEYNYFVGAGVYELSKRVLPADLQVHQTILNYKELFNEDYNKNWDVATLPYEGIIDTLEFIAKKNLKLAIFSNKPDYFCKDMAKHYFEMISFDEVRGNVENLLPKPSPEGGVELIKNLNIQADEVLYIGDSNIDMELALNCGFYGIGAEWGFRTKQELIDAGAKQTFETPVKLLEYLKELL